MKKQAKKKKYNGRKNGITLEQSSRLAELVLALGCDLLECEALVKRFGSYR